MCPAYQSPDLLPIPQPRRTPVPKLAMRSGLTDRLPGPRSVSTAQRLAALAELRKREPGLTFTQGVAVVDAAADCMSRVEGDELAGALLDLASSEPVTTAQTYLAFLAPTSARRTKGHS